MKFRQLFFSLIATSLAGVLIGCSNSSSSKSTGGSTGGSQMSIILSVLPSSIAEGASAKVFAIVNNDSQNEGVTWSLSCGGSSCGTLSGTSPNFVLYTAPSTVISGTVTITATAVADSSVTSKASFTIAAATTLADGTYVFSLAGQDGNGLYRVAGAFEVFGGVTMGGEQDFLDQGTSTQGNKIIVGGKITRSKSTGNVQVNLNVLTNSNSFQPGVGGVETLDVTMITGTHALIAEYDGFATSSGTLDMQTSSAAPAGGYAFVLSGLDNNSLPAAVGGVLNIDTASGLDGTGSVFDVNDDFNVTPQTQNLHVDSGTISTNEPFGLSLGRVTISLNLQSSGFGGLGLVGYPVDANHMVLVENNNDPNDVFFAGSPGHIGGTAFSQGTNTGGFTAASPSVSGASYVFGTSGMDTIGPYQVAGVVTLNSDLSAGGTLNFNDLSGSGPQAAIPFTGTYTVDSTGRITLSNLTAGVTSLEMYLDGNGNAAVISMDANTDEVTGLAAQQTGGGSFSASSFSGTYGLDATGWSGNEVDEIGIVAADGPSSTLSGAVDQNFIFVTGSQPSDTSVTGSFTASANGVFTGSITSLDVNGNQDAFNYYVIDPTRVMAIETDQNQLTLGYFELKQ